MYNGAMAQAAEQIHTWTPRDAEVLYQMGSWSDAYFFVNDQGHVAVSPSRQREGSIDIHEVVTYLRAQNIDLPVLIRFQDVLRGRVEQINEAFADAIEEFDYGNRYTGVYPVKVNQMHEVVEEVLEAGRPYGMGLECGSKAELIATLPHLEDDQTLLICNGYKDAAMLRLILTGQQLGKNVIPVVEKYDEFERLMRHAAEMQVTPRFGVRVHLATQGSGKWAESSGDLSKFGVTVPELLRLVAQLQRNVSSAGQLALLHFHLGSQIADIQTLKQAVKQVTRIYVQLYERGLPIEYIDVGGGLGVNYGAGYSGSEDSVNYTLQEYANSAVYAIKEVCDAEEVPHPTIVSESGRALTAHHSVLIVNVLGTYAKEGVDADFTPDEDAHAVVHELYAVLEQARTTTPEPEMPHRVPSNLLEAYHDAVEMRGQAQSLFTLGYLPIEQLGCTERLFWSICRAIHAQAAAYTALPSELRAIEAKLVNQYLCDFSVFQSVLDHWAIGQRFPIMPIHRLDEYPTERAVLVDLTCDSDGKIDCYIDAEGVKEALEVHPPRPGEPYYLGFFMMGAYQDIMGDMHNLFGRVTEVHVYADAEEPEGFYIEKMIPGAAIEEMLAQVQYTPHDLHRRMRALIQNKIAEGVVRPRAGMDMLQAYDSAFRLHTYLSPDSE